MSISNIITTNTYDLFSNSLDSNDININDQLSFSDNPGEDGEIVVNDNGIPVWKKIEPPSFQSGPDNTYLYSNNNEVSWSPLNVQVCSYAPNGKVDGGDDDPDPQDIGGNFDFPQITKFQVTLLSNPNIITHPNDENFIIQSSGLYKITFCGSVYNNNNSIGFGFCLNEVQDYRYGFCATSPIDTDFFTDIPGSFRNGAGQGVCIVRILNLVEGEIFQVLCNKQYQNGLLPTNASNYFVGQRSSSLTFEFLGNNYTG
jgi:hypothetical protein